MNFRLLNTIYVHLWVCYFNKMTKMFMTTMMMMMMIIIIIITITIKDIDSAKSQMRGVMLMMKMSVILPATRGPL